MLTKRRKGFTLIELLVVVAIIALLVSILLPSLAKAKQIAKTIVCGNRHKACYTGWAFYANDFGKRMAWWDQTDVGNAAYRQFVYTMWYYVQGVSLPGAAYTSGGWYNVATERYGDGFGMFTGRTPTVDMCPNYQCSELESMIEAGTQPPEYTPIHPPEVSTMAYAMPRRWNTTRNVWESPNNYYPNPDLFTHPGTSLLLVCPSGTSTEDSINMWTSYQPNVIANKHGGKSNYTFDDGHVETLRADQLYETDLTTTSQDYINETNSLMWCQTWERGQDVPLN